MIAKKQITLAHTALSKKISTTQIKIQKKTQAVINKPVQLKNEIYNVAKSKKPSNDFFLTLKSKIKKYDERWLERIEKSSLRQ